MPKRLMKRFYKQAATLNGKPIINRRRALKLARYLAAEWRQDNPKAEELSRHA